MSKILVVDDEPDLETLILQKFRHYIRQRTWHFTFVTDGLQALSVLQTDQEFDLVLTDINMPGLDGLALIERLPELNPALKAVIITAYGDIGNIRAAMHRGAYDFLTKPIDLFDLEHTITRALHHVQQYVRQINRLTDAAAAIEEGHFDPNLLAEVCQCPGALGRLGRVFHAMILEVYHREQQLRQQVQDLQIEIDHSKRARQVAEVTDSDYFRRLQQMAHMLRERSARPRFAGDEEKKD